MGDGHNNETFARLRAAVKGSFSPASTLYETVVLMTTRVKSGSDSKKFGSYVI
jgi:hypothetical protein